MRSESERASTSYDETLSREIASELRCSTSARRETFEKIREVERLLRGLKEKDVKAVAPGWFSIECEEVVGKTLRFSPPTRVRTIGSHAEGGCGNVPMNGNGSIVVDVALEMPKSFFQEKDYLDHRYHFKRAVYLEVLLKALSKSQEWACEIIDQHQDPRKPYINMHFGEKGAKRSLRLLLTIDAETFASIRLLPSRANLRSLELKGGERPASPHYNQTIAEDMYANVHAQYFAAASAKAKSLPVAVLLVKRWAQGRRLMDGVDGVNGLFISMLLTYMMEQGGQLSTSMEANQMFRAALAALASPGFFKKGLFVCGRPEEADEWQATFPHVFLGPCGRVNFMARMSPSAVAELIHEATLSSAELKKSNHSAFSDVLLGQFPAAVRYDLHIHVDVNVSELGAASERDLNARRTVEVDAAKIVSRALSDRAKLVRAVEVSNSSVNVIGSQTCTLWIGVVLDPENALRLVDVGPSSSDDREAKEFRAFWGDRSELRRFKDGRICESVVWDAVPPLSRHHIPAMAAEQALKRNMTGIDGIEWSSKIFDEPVSKIASASEGTTSAGLLQTLDRLAKRMRDLKEMPLKVNNVQPLSGAFRGTDPCPPKPHPLAHGAGIGLGMGDDDIPACPKTLDIMVSLEGSGRWPDDPVAIEKTKAMMAVQLAESLRKSYAMPSIVAEEAVDILFEGYAFRVHVSASAGGPHVKDMEENILQRAAHAGLIASVAARFPMYGAATQLVNRWAASHMFSPHLSDEAIEALVALLFINPGALSPPMSREVAFIRFLNLISSHMWYDPVVLDPESVLSIAEVEGIDRQAKDAPAMCIVTPHDKSGSRLTMNKPSAVVLKRLESIAARATSEMQAVLEGTSTHSMFETECWERFFKPSLSGFDAAFILRRTALPFPKEALFPSKRLYKRMRTQFENEMSVVDEDEDETLAQSIKLAKIPRKLLAKGPDKAREALLVGFDSTGCFISAAERRLGGTALLFVDKYGGDVVGVAFKPKAVHIDAALPESVSWLPNPAPPSREDVIEEIAVGVGADFVEKVLT